MHRWALRLLQCCRLRCSVPVDVLARVRRAEWVFRGAQYLGWYDPLRKETNLNAPSIKKWISVGAQTSDTVGNLLKKAMVID